MAEPSGRATNRQGTLVRKELETPKAAAIAGILFALLFTATIVLIRLAIPETLNGVSVAEWLGNRTRSVSLALTLVPFAGIAFLWFMGVVRSRIGELEDQLFSTVFYGSGLLFLAMTFVSAALAGGILSSYALGADQPIADDVLVFGRAVMYNITNIYAIRMAGVFMLSLGTIWVRTGVMPRGLAFLTYIVALFLLLAINLSLWAILAFPAWVLIISVFILIANLRGQNKRSAELAVE